MRLMNLECIGICIMGKIFNEEAKSVIVSVDNIGCATRILQSGNGFGLFGYRCIGA